MDLKPAPIKHKERAGLTLIETVVSLFLFAIFITGACKVVMAHRQLMNKSKSHYTAVNIAKNQIEQIRNTLSQTGYDQINNNEESNIQVSSNGDVSSTGKYRRTTEITQVNNDMSEIVVTVQVLDRITLTFGDENEELRTYIARPMARSL